MHKHAINNDLREEKGYTIAQTHGDVKRIDEFNYRVKSQSGKGEYEIISTEFGLACSCPDFLSRNVKCKHCYAIEFSLKFRKTVQVTKIEPITDVSSCIYCKSNSIVKNGIRHNKWGDIQKFCCHDCSRTFSVNIGFERMKHDPKGITTAMQLYYSGESLRNTAESLKLLGMEVSHQTIYKWIRKYTKLMTRYLEQITPSVSGTWRTDELFLKVKGDQKYLYALMDDETRYWIAQQVADTKFTHDVRPLFKEGKELMGKKPDMLISDGAPNFHEAYKKEYWSRIAPRTSHIRHIHLKGDKNNNKMERMNGEVRDREKVMRGLKITETPILKGYQIFHNHIREHEALEGKTPGEAAGIEIKGENKWITLIQNASKKN